MTAFDLVSALFGGGLIGLASALLMLLNGRIAGVSGILGGALAMSAADKIWRLAFIAGLIAAPIFIALIPHPPPRPQKPATLLSVVISFALLCFSPPYVGRSTPAPGPDGTTPPSGSLHGATSIFMLSAIGVVAIMRHGFGV